MVDSGADESAAAAAAASDSSATRPHASASAQVFALAELVQLIAAHVDSQDLAAFRLVNRSAGVYGAPHQFVSHCYVWPKSRSFARLTAGPGASQLRFLRHLVADTGVGAWSSFGNDFVLTEKRKAQWQGLYALLEHPELTGLETVDLKSSIRWATQLDQLTQPWFNINNRISNHLRSLCLTGITEAMDRYWEISLARHWWNAISNLIEHCIERQRASGHVKFRHFHLAVEGDATVLCGPPTVGFTTAFRQYLLGELESLTFGKLSQETSRALLGPLNIHPSAQISQYVTYEWPVWKNLRKLRLTFGRVVDIAASRLCDHVLDHCPVLEELYLGFGPAQPILLQTRISHLRHLSIDFSELVLGAHIRGAEERQRLHAFVCRNPALITLSMNYIEVRDHRSGKYAGKMFSGLPPIEVSADELPQLQACEGNYVTYRPSPRGQLVYWHHDSTHTKAQLAPAKPNLSHLLEDHLAPHLHNLDSNRLTFLAVSETSKVLVEQTLQAILAVSAQGRFQRLAEIEVRSDLMPDASPLPQSTPGTRVVELIRLASQIPSVRAIRLAPPPERQKPLQHAVEEILVSKDTIGLRLQYIGVGLEIYERTNPTEHQVSFRQRIGRHHPLLVRTLVEPEPRLPLWWGEDFKLREQTDVVGFRDPFPSILEHFGIPPRAAWTEKPRSQAATVSSLPAPRTLPTYHP